MAHLYMVINYISTILQKVHFNAELQAAIDNVLSVRVAIEICHGNIGNHGNWCGVFLAGILP